MVPDDTVTSTSSTTIERDTDRSATDSADNADVRAAVADGGAGPASAANPTPPSDSAYDQVYQATKDAIWYVVGTVTLALFHFVLALIALAVAWDGVATITGSQASQADIAVGIIAAGIFLFSSYRVYVLMTE
ncbi:hypothetical protein GL213_00225 [Halogeometricum borinquense]|uniref:Uncharacterized protein n=1 Tax=Halogeometricum borinquense TaxID=60847 RepID=A0A6C0UJ06_9EURY|nr:hypothetical protein [Halogeometricum borinquense]QIB72938.1 hypothetical protein G3I44_00730 [Halogeometricum borinquense]QIQ75103.1 hypothetical protein GL213_00225 [Halogeometricum borinquense]